MSELVKLELLRSLKNRNIDGFLSFLWEELENGIEIECMHVAMFFLYGIVVVIAYC